MKNNMNQTDLFDPPTGTDPKTLARTKDPRTSKEAARSTNTARWERRVLNAIAKFGKNGAIQDDILRSMRAEFGQLPYSTVTARFKALSDKGLIEYTGKKRKGDSGRESRVRRIVKNESLNKGAQ